jgi:hypothetical protein
VGRRYDVRLSVAGKQHHIACASTQPEGAKLYDLALWKLGPKMTRKLEPNFLDDFSFITQDMVDRLCPRLNALYEDLPFASLADESRDENDLREERLSGKAATLQRGLADYNDVLLFLKRGRVGLLELSRKWGSRRLKLRYIHKLPAVQSEMETMESLIENAIESVQKVEGLMESQRAYYQKLTNEGDGL